MKIADPLFPNYQIDVQGTVEFNGILFYKVWRRHPGDMHFVCSNCRYEFFAEMDAKKHETCDGA